MREDMPKAARRSAATNSCALTEQGAVFLFNRGVSLQRTVGKTFDLELAPAGNSLLLPHADRGRAEADFSRSLRLESEVFDKFLVGHGRSISYN